VRECLGQALAALTLVLEALICRAAAHSERVAGSLKRLANPNGSSNRCGLSMEDKLCESITPYCLSLRLQVILGQ
jgi:hypothetical protein